MESLMDRVSTTWSVLNGVTFNCVQCHSHPYDPIRHPDYYKSLAFFNTSNDADRDDDFPNLKVPKDKAKYSEAAEIQQEIDPLLHSVVNTDRELVENAQWQSAPIQTAGADEVPAIEAILPDSEEYLEKLEKTKYPAAQKKEDINNQLETIRVLKQRLADAKARGGPAKTFHINNGEAFADAETPSKSVYDLVATPNLPTNTAPAITAVRIEVLPLDAAKARHTPEDGFIVDRTQAFLIGPNGRKERLAFKCFIHDSKENLQISVSPSDDDNHKDAPKEKESEDGFAANPNSALDRRCSYSASEDRGEHTHTGRTQANS